MAWSPLSGLPNPIIVDAAGTAGSGYVLKAYLPGTTTSTSLAIDADGSSPQTSITANSEGKFEVSGNEVLPHIDRECKWGIFENSVDAAANTPFYMGPFDNVQQSAGSANIESRFNESFDTVALMDASTTLLVGERVRTLGHASLGNGGGNDYEIVAAGTGTHDNGSYIDLAGSGHQAKGLFSDGTVNIKQYGAVGDGTPTGGGTDDSTAMTNAIAAHSTIHINNSGSNASPTRYRINSTVTVVGNRTIVSDGAVINKEFAGIGLEFNGGSNYIHITGHLIVEGVGAHASNTALASTNPTSHGVKFTGTRIRVDGFFYSQANQGNGFEMESNSGNSNGSEMHNLIADNNGMAGINCTSTQDDCSVWSYTWSARANRLQGVNYNTNWLGRSHEGYVYCEANGIDVTTNAACYIGQLRNSRLFIYSEQQIAGPEAIQVASACINLAVHDSRQSKTTISPTAAFNGCKVVAGGELWAGGQGDEAIHGRLKLAGANDSGSKWSDSVVLNSDSNEVARDRFKGNGDREMWAIDPADTAGTVSLMSGTAHITRVSVDGTTTPQDLLVQTKTDVYPGVHNTYDLGISANRWKIGYILQLVLGSGGVTLNTGSGSPEGVLTANTGSLYLNTSGGGSTTLYIKESGSGNTGWVAK